jgi:hypothetical protein
VKIRYVFLYIRKLHTIKLVNTILVSQEERHVTDRHFDFSWASGAEALDREEEEFAYSVREYIVSEVGKDVPGRRRNEMKDGMVKAVARRRNILGRLR